MGPLSPEQLLEPQTETPAGPLGLALLLRLHQRSQQMAAEVELLHYQEPQQVVSEHLQQVQLVLQHMLAGLAAHKLQLVQ
jgi:hypothetical protein